jgi:HlyD family secretion protein
VVSGPFRVIAKTLKDGNAVIIKDAKTLSKEAVKDEPEGDKQ